MVSQEDFPGQSLSKCYLNSPAYPEITNVSEHELEHDKFLGTGDRDSLAEQIGTVYSGDNIPDCYFAMSELGRHGLADQGEWLESWGEHIPSCCVPDLDDGIAWFLSSTRCGDGHGSGLEMPRSSADPHGDSSALSVTTDASSPLSMSDSNGSTMTADQDSPHHQTHKLRLRNRRKQPTPGYSPNLAAQTAPPRQILRADPAQRPNRSASRREREECYCDVLDCLWKDENGYRRPFGRWADLERHKKNCHSDLFPGSRFKCVCKRSFPSSRRDKYKEHLDKARLIGACGQ